MGKIEWQNDTIAFLWYNKVDMGKTEWQNDIMASLKYITLAPVVYSYLGISSFSF